jgi:O-antigen ligase
VSATQPLGPRAAAEAVWRSNGGLAWTGAAALLGCALAFGLARNPPPLDLVVVGGAGLVALLGLALVRYEAVVVLGFVLFGVVFVEPAPPDLVFAVAIAVAFVTGRTHLRQIPPSIVLLLGFFLLLNLVSATATVDAGRAGVFFFVTAYLVAFSVWLTAMIDSEAWMRLILRALLVGAVASALIGILAPFLPFAAAQAWHNEGRAKAFFEDPNVFGPFLVLPALILVEELLQPRLLHSRRATKLALFFILTLGILFAYSRAAWLNAAVAAVTMIAVLGLRRGGGRKAFVLVGTIAVAVVVLVGAISLSGSGDFLQERARFQSYDQDRFAAQRAGIDVATEHPFGVGPGQFKSAVGYDAHNTFIRALAEQGFLGLLTVVLLFAITLGAAARNAAAGRRTYGIGSAALLAAWCGILVNSLFVDTLHWRHLWLLAALIWIGAMLGRSAPRERF